MGNPAGGGGAGARRSASEIEAELRSHLRLRADDLEARGLPRGEAERRAALEFGAAARYQEECREALGSRALGAAARDLRYAARQLRRSPGYTLVAVITLALGIGAATAVFSAVNAALLAPLPFPHPARLVGIENGSYPMAGYAAMRAQLRTMRVAAYAAGRRFSLIQRGQPLRVEGALVSDNLFRVLGARAELGATFAPGEDAAGQDGYAVLSDALWRRRFGADPAIIGRTIRLDGVARLVVGVMPAGFAFPGAATRIWIPLGIDPGRPTHYWAGPYMPVIGRLRPGATRARATAEVRLFQARLRRLIPWPMPPAWNRGLAVVPLRQALEGEARSRLLLLLAAVLLVLGIAVANVVNLNLARAAERGHELALRTALGAGRARLIGHRMAESLLVAAGGGVAGVALGVAAMPLLRILLPGGAPHGSLALDPRVAAFAAGVTALAGVAAGLLPGLRAAPDPAVALRRGGRAVAGAGDRRAREYLVAGEVALAVLLVSAAGLLITSLWRLTRVQPGFQVQHVLTARVTPSAAFCRQPERCGAFYRTLLRRVRALPGVSAAAVINTPPLGGQVSKRSVHLAGKAATGQDLPLVWEKTISPGYFRVLGIPLTRGRSFRAADAAGAPAVAIVSTATARRFWPDQNPVGEHLRLAKTTDWVTVVGVVPAVRAYSLERAIPDWMNGAIYLPFGPKATLENGAPPEAMTLVLRTAAVTAAIAPAIRRTVAGLPAQAAVGEIRTMRQMAQASRAPTRSVASLFAVFAGLALALSAVGIYGVVSLLVRLRRREFAIRMALGARPLAVVTAVLRQGLALALMGIAAGLLAAVWLTHFLAAWLYGVGAADPATLGLVVALFAGVAVAACAVPAWRAVTTDPVTVLRQP